MSRKTYIADNVISLSEFIDNIDDINNYECWHDQDTQKGYNYISNESFEEFCKGAIKSKFYATIIRNNDEKPIGSIFVSPENTLPDLTLMIYKPYRNQGYGTLSFSLGVKYCFEILKLDKIYAGVYKDNLASMRMLEKCGFHKHPKGNQNEKHYITGENITQFDYVKYNSDLPK